MAVGLLETHEAACARSPSAAASVEMPRSCRAWPCRVQAALMYMHCLPCPRSHSLVAFCNRPRRASRRSGV
eukprot:9726396-Alexandrium_andersonii.AAC.1